MPKRVFFFAALMAAFLAFGIISHAESGIRLQYGKNTYTIKQASQPESKFPFTVSEKDNAVALADKDSGISAEIRQTKMDKPMADALRSYYNDNSLTGGDLFPKLTGLAESYIDAAAANSRTGYLFGNGGKPGSEEVMKLFVKTQEKLFGQDSDIFIYNTGSSGATGFTEKTHLDIFIPIRSSFTLLNINFTLSGGTLNIKNLEIMNRMFRSIRIPGSTLLPGNFSFPGDSSMMAAVNSGIYPGNLDEKSPTAALVEPEQGFSLTYPASLVQYMKNNIIDKLYYNSFKVSLGEIISISVQPADDGMNAASQKLNSIKESFGASVKVLSEGASFSEGRETVFLTCLSNSSPDGAASWVQEYLTAANGKLYRLRLESTGGQPSAPALYAYSVMTDSLKFSDISPKTVDNGKYTVFTDEKTGITFQYPSYWKLVKEGENTLQLKLSLPELSDYLSIYIRENKDGIPPYGGLPHTVLASSVWQEDSILYSDSLVNYIDESGRGILLSSSDINKEDRTWSMYIMVNGIWAVDGRIADPDLSEALNVIKNSFSLQDSSGLPTSAPANTLASPENNKGCGSSATPPQNISFPGSFFIPAWFGFRS